MTTVYKLKSSKSHKEPEADCENSDCDSGEHGFPREKPYKSSGSSRPQTRSAEFRSSRSAAGGRAAFRGRRGEAAPRRGDRGDYGGADGYYGGGRKYENNSSSGFRGKVYESDSNKKQQDVGQKLQLPEDTRISKLLRRLNNETNQEASLQISKKLLEVLMLPDNAAYVRKAFHILGESMYEILHVSPGLLAKQQVARALGRMGYIMGQEADFDRFQNWLFAKLAASYEDQQSLLVASLRETLALETQKPVLDDQTAENLIQNLVSVLEVAENVEVFKIVLEVLVEIVEIYPNEFFGQFRDTIDLLFGWHVDHSQPLQVIEFISMKMQKLSQHFRLNVDFSVGLIENFLEDIRNFSEIDLDHVTVLILALNTVLKCLTGVKLNADLIVNCLMTITDLIDVNLPGNLLIAVNDCICQLVGHLGQKPLNISQKIYKIIENYSEGFDVFADKVLTSCLVLTAKVVKELSADLPLNLVENLIGPKSRLLKLRLQNRAAICVYQNLVNLKNVSLLQEVYKFLLGDLQACYKTILPETDFSDNADFIYETKNADQVLFLLRSLSQLANGSSIIVMWALKPSILELIVKMRPSDAILARKYPHVQFCLLHLLFAHCRCFNHFIMNSDLVEKGDFSKFALNSENSGNFGAILEMLQQCLIDCSEEVCLLLLDWIRDVLVRSETYLEFFYLNEKFLKLTRILVENGHNFDIRIVLAVGENLQKLLRNTQLIWPEKLLIDICHLCKLQMNSTSKKAQKCFSTLCQLLPCQITISELNRPLRDQKILAALNWHLNGTIDCPMLPHQFKIVMNLLLENQTIDLQEIFTTTWQLCNNDNQTFYDSCLSFREILHKWCAFEAAQFCVNNKLRTPLGKPNETFTKIEFALNRLMKFGNYEQQTRIRIFLQFMEFLEKSIYNAGEGCAVAMRQPPKNVRQFFVANAKTCNEWLLRLKIQLMFVALHCGEAAAALRHGHCLLNDPKTQTFEKILVFSAISLLSLREPEALMGFYVWAKSRGKKFSWLRCASEQASGKFELALEGYRKLSEETNEEVIDFVNNQILNCHKELNDFGNLSRLGEQKNFKIIDEDFFDFLQRNSLENLGSWQLKNEKSSWSVYDNLANIEANLLTENQFLAQTLEAIEENLQNLLPVVPNEFLQNYSLLQHVAKRTNFTPNNFQNLDTSILSKILFWSTKFNRTDSNLLMELAKRARKNSNLNFATNQLQTYFRNKQIDLTELDFDVCTIDTCQALVEHVKLTYVKNQDKTVALNLCAQISTKISKYSEIYSSQEHKKISSKLLVKLANWMQLTEVNCTELNSDLGKLLMVLPEMDNSGGLIGGQDVAVGKLLRFSANQCPALAKSWNSFGDWCYKWGKKVVDHSAGAGAESLSDDLRSEIENLLPQNHSLDDLEKILSILSQTGDEDKNPWETIEAQLRAVPALQNPALLHQILQIWRDAQKKLYFYYSLSAEAYFKYLQLSETNCHTITITLRLLRLTVKYASELQLILEQGLKTTPTRPWKSIIPQLFSRLNHPENYVRQRVSELLCRVAHDAPHLITFPAVVGALEGGFSEIRLLETENDDEEEEEEEKDDEEDEEEEEETDELQSCFETMVETLSEQDAETIAQVRLLVRELRRITLLWDELWLGTLAQHQGEIGKRQQQLEYEIEKVNENSNLSPTEKSSLIAEKHRIIVKPIVFVLEQLRDVTGADPETPHERHFQEKYVADIDRCVAVLKNPDSPEKPQESLAPLKQLQKKFQQKFHKRASYSLKMRDISPVLHSIRNTMIAMPGVATGAGVTIEHVGDVVSILPTKTKPKKLVFYGSDGKTYTYLFKGLEDLHLDERIMQFLSIANTMMAQNADPAGENLYRARHYSVIPLGRRSGLISWVDGTTPVFALYKRWQQRELAKPNAKGSATVPRPSELFYNKLMEHGVANIDNRKEWPLATLRDVLSELMAETPSDLIAKELWCNSVSASAWWQVVKRYSYSVAVMSIIGYIIGLGDRHLDNVLIDLATGDVVHIDYNVCFEKGKTLRVPEKVPFRLTPNIRDALGVTGVEGIFRLACENVLKTMRKGRETLLTLLEAFVYDPLIDWTVGGEVLAGTTFAAKVGGAGGGKRMSKKELEREVTLAMFDVRCTEMTVEWQENKDDILAEIPPLVEHLDACLALTREIDETEDELRDFHQQLALVKEAEAQGPKKHPLYKLPGLYESYIGTQGAANVAHKALSDVKRDCDAHAHSFEQLLASYEAQQFAGWLDELKFDESEDAKHVFDLVKEFLHNAGKDDVVTQCEQSENEVSQLSQHLNLQTRKCIQTFQDYFSLLVQCPKSYIERHRTTLYPKWADYLLETRSLDGCDVIFEELKAFLDGDSANSSQIVSCACALDALYKKSLLQVNKLYEELGGLRTGAETSYDQAKRNVAQFAGQATEALEFVIAGELLCLNRNLLNSEITAQKSGSWLIKLMSLDGDWFLDDLLLQSTRIVEIVDSVPLRDDDDPRLAQVTAGIKAGNAVYKGLYELNFNFHTIILPETMKKIMADEESVLTMIADLNRVIADVGVPIHELIGELEKLLTCVLMHVDVHTTYDHLLAKTAAFKLAYHALIPANAAPAHRLGQGQMLLMGFNGLFEKVTLETHRLAHALGRLDLPKPWKKLDHVVEAKTIAPHIFNEKVKKILDDLFFLKRVLAIEEFFGKCLKFKVDEDEDFLSKSVRGFVSEFVARQVLGILPEAVVYFVCLILQKLQVNVTNEIEQKDFGAESKVPLDDLFKKSYQILLRKSVFAASQFSEASSLLLSLKQSWNEHQKPKKLEQKLTFLRSSLFRLQTQISIHNLMFDEILLRHNRQKFIGNCQTELNQLQIFYRRLQEARANQQILIEKSCQRLNWAKGANPNCQEILDAFQNILEAQQLHLNSRQKLAKIVAQNYQIMLRHEALRSTNSDYAKDFDNRFLTAFDKWRQSCQYKLETLLPTEESILNLLSMESIKNPKWLHQVAHDLTQLIGICQKKLQQKKEEFFLKIDSLVFLINNFKSIFNVHTRLVQDVKGLVKTMSKIDWGGSRARLYARQYGEYVGKFAALFAAFKDQALDRGLIEEMKMHLDFIGENTEKIYGGLMNLRETGNGVDVDEPSRSRRQSLTADSGGNKSKIDSRGQQRNAYAMNVWRKVKMKLEGRDPDPGRKCTAQEQVDYVIREATSLENLALLYEGWTPWV